MTAHIEAKKNEIASIVLMPGDPLRAEFIAKNFLKDAKLVSKVRNNLIFTGEYKGKKVTIAASGMGSGSIGIYAYELFKFYDVEKIIRIGSAGSYDKDLEVYSLVIANSAWSDSCSFPALISGKKVHLAHPNPGLVANLFHSATKLGLNPLYTRIHSTDVFYSSRNLEKTIELSKAKAVEMESFALFTIANYLGKKAASILTISDNLITKSELDSVTRQEKFVEMIEIALEAI
ncbi:purine nucleoside phosphorylase DeoD-type [Mesomycoplasma hyopneumoniae]|uniref:Uridine phosphorylase n=2 Tax=Mesomycoplasma hyopneumoniae (strain 168) TaxID=907287 RepID=E4QS89_MESH1|nr:purine-nucleoside phosphorylase [Mesomycoplasma hyopneumoniae]ADQ90309.1 Purine-nucleoside phosphorylase [Mesomycoplasma hyopneumoniae 168]AGM21866.1 Purine-nucleoside phosphorylase [Mesomycoplasma hyopneumoniae 168-L]OWY73562.1 purine nucleoside phosphorylase DeoD-type [Mesomycoplasma hyopneumoniae]OWY73605.1 purine nucleoside phosphorylase DeoD-type [Mesomycoplasma hyopneumoniae]QBY87411.1 DeoD-type purine-nucleoside phosphorylase [Mesomycoplasma hyopneumoniae]